MDLLLDDGHDMVFDNGNTPVTSERRDVIGQRLTIRLLTFLGEWRYRTSYGVPYYQRVFGKRQRKSDIDSVFQTEILKEPGVKSIVDFESTLDNREYSLSFRVRIDTGDITDNIQISPGA